MLQNIRKDLIKISEDVRNSDKNHWIKYYFPAVGYFIVAYFCLMCGLSKNLNRPTFIPCDIYSFTFIMLLIPYYLHKVILMEDESRTELDIEGKLLASIDKSNISTYIPQFVACISITMIVFFGYHQYTFSHNLSLEIEHHNNIVDSLSALYQMNPIFPKINSGFTLPNNNNSIFSMKKWLSLFVGLLPFVVLAYHSYYRLKIRETGLSQEKAFSFSNYIFFPSLATCLFPFILGYSNFTDFKLITSLVGIFLIYYTLTNLFYSRSRLIRNLNLCVVLSYIVSLIVAGVYSIKTYDFSNTVQITLVGITISLIMGVLQSCWFIRQKETVHLYEKEIYDGYERNIDNAVCFFPVLSVILFYYPTINIHYFYAVCMFLLILVTWIMIEDYPHRTKFLSWRYSWSFLKLIYGVVIIYCLYRSISTVFQPNEFIIEKFGRSPFYTIAGIVSLASTMIFGFVGNFTEGLKLSVKDFSNMKLSRIVMFFISCILLVVTLLLNYFLFDKSLKGIELNIKSNMALFFYLIIYLFMLCWITIDNFVKKRRMETETTHNGKLISSKNELYIELINAFKSSRPATSLIAFLFSFSLIAFKLNYPIIESLLLSLPMYLITSIGFIANDLYDIEKDKYTQSNKYLITGGTNTKSMWKVMIVMLIALSIIIFFCYSNNLFVGCLGILVSVYFYSPFAQRVPQLKWLYTALLCLTPLLYVSYVFHLSYSSKYLIPILLFISGREIILDVFDMDADFKFGLKTIPNMIGRKWAIIISIILILSSAIFFMLIMNFTTIGIIALTLCLTSILLSIYFVLKHQENNFISSSRVGMIAAIILFICVL